MKNTWFLLLFTVTLISGCGSADKNFAENEDYGEQQIYEQAKRALKLGRFEIAISAFETLEARFPFSRYALQTQLDLMYAYYRFNQPETAIIQADRFIRLNPTHKNVDYAYYIKGLSNFDLDKGILDKWFPKDAAQYDQKHLQESFKDFGRLIRKFPDSQYTPDAKRRMVFLRNKMAEHEIIVAKFHMTRKAYVAAINRVKYVLKNLYQTPSTADALSIMVEAYTKLEMKDLAKNTDRVLKLNFPNFQASKN